MKLQKAVSKKEAILFIGFYITSALLYYTASWVSWGGFKPGHPSYFNFEEFSASGGLLFFISFLLTLPIWYVTIVLLHKRTLTFRLLTHLFFLPVYIASCYALLSWGTSFFGWAMYWGGYKMVWTLYIFLLFYLVQFGFLHAYNYFKRFKIEEKEKALLREVALHSEIVALKSQLNPHFLHNLFNSINATIPQENERTRELIVQLSDLFRYQNYASQHDFVTIKEELDFMESYLQLMQIRLKERLQYSFEVPHDIYNNQIAPMLLHPLVENAVNHGIASRITPSKLLLKIEHFENRLRFTIADTGVGIADKMNVASKGLGISTTKMRLLKLYNSDLLIEDNLPTGTKISFLI